MWIVSEWSDYESGPTRITVWSDAEDAERCRSDWESEWGGECTVRIEVWNANVDSGMCPWEPPADRETILSKAIALIKRGKKEDWHTGRPCLFEALDKVTKVSWNGGFGRGTHSVIWGNGRKSHATYAATRLALPNPEQALRCFSESASEDEMIDVLEKAKTVEIR